jgi:hypothetical protein
VQDQRIALAEGVTHARANHTDESEHRKVIGIYPRGHSPRESIKRGPLERRENACLLSLSITKSFVFVSGFAVREGLAARFGLDREFHLHDSFGLVFSAALLWERRHPVVGSRVFWAR